tara:strand:+ start:574 stop:942 length:369 start_codon:yes stop_codon:yes gene_type:complete
MKINEYKELIKKIRFVSNEQKTILEIFQELNLINKRLQQMNDRETFYGDNIELLTKTDYHRTKNAIIFHLTIIDNLIDSREACDQLPRLYPDHSWAAKWIEESKNYNVFYFSSIKKQLNKGA